MVVLMRAAEMLCLGLVGVWSLLYQDPTCWWAAACWWHLMTERAKRHERDQDEADA